MSNPARKLPDLHESYIDEFGAIDPEVYAAAQSVWPRAERFALETLYDADLGVRLMMRAVARVTAAIASGVEVLNLRFYLYRTYKNVVLAELEKENNRAGLLEEKFAQPQPSAFDSEQTLNRKIVINELRLEMDPWARDVFDLQVLGYTFEEMVPEYGSAANVIRSKFSKNLFRLRKKIALRTKGL